MSIVPLLANLARELDSGYHTISEFEDFLDDDFGFGLHPVDIFRPRPSHHTSLLLDPRRRYCPYLLGRPHRHGHLGRNSASSAARPVVGKDGFQVCMDVSQFRPNELTVKTVDNTVVVEGKHEEREDEHGLVQRHFVRKYTLPKDYDPKEVVSTISSDGVLTVKAPPPPNRAVKQKERLVQIQHTGPAHLSVKAPEQSKDAETEKMETGK